MFKSRDRTKQGSRRHAANREDRTRSSRPERSAREGNQRVPRSTTIPATNTRASVNTTLEVIEAGSLSQVSFRSDDRIYQVRPGLDDGEIDGADHDDDKDDSLDQEEHVAVEDDNGDEDEDDDDDDSDEADENQDDQSDDDQGQSFAQRQLPHAMAGLNMKELPLPPDKLFVDRITEKNVLTYMYTDPETNVSSWVFRSSSSGQQGADGNSSGRGDRSARGGGGGRGNGGGGDDFRRIFETPGNRETQYPGL